MRPATKYDHDAPKLEALAETVRRRGYGTRSLDALFSCRSPSDVPAIVCADPRVLHRLQGIGPR